MFLDAEFPLALLSFSLSFSASVFVLVLLILAAVGISVFLYWHTIPDITPRRRIVLMTLRSLALALLLFILFEPILNLQQTESIPPHVAALLDNSKSMTVQDNGAERSVSLRSMIDGADFRAIGEKAEAVSYLFATNAHALHSITSDSLTFTGVTTDISSALQLAHDDLKEKNLRAIVLATDGNVTLGKNPLYMAEALGIPVFVIGVGDSSQKKDILISRVLANSIAYVESSIPIDVTVRSSGFDGVSASVTLFEGQTAVETKPIVLQPGSNEYPLHFAYVPKSEGVKKMVVEVKPLEGELTTKNNRRTFFIKVLKSKMNIVVVAGAPSPDVSLFDQVFKQDKNVTVLPFVQKFENTWYGNAPTSKTFADADCLVLVGYPLPQSGTDALKLIKDAMEKKNTPLFLLFSRGIDLFKLRSVLDAFLPFDIVQTRADETQVFFDLNQEARQNPVTATGIPVDVWEKLPPLFKTESSFKARVGVQVLGQMKINNIPFNEPLMMTRKLNRSKIVVFTGYGLWRWQLAYDVLNGRLPNLLVSNVIRWLTTREDDKPVRIKATKEFFDNGEAIEFIGQVYNESYEPVDNASVVVKVKGPDGEQEVMLNPQGAGRYTASLEEGREGDFTYMGTATQDGTMLGKDEGRFSVGELNIEFQETQMNNILLRQIAAKTGGKYYSVASISGLADDIAALSDFKPQEHIERSDIQLWNLVWLLAGAILCFAVEWYLRKQAGMI